MNGSPVCKLEEIPPGTSQLVTVEGKEVALFNVEGRLYAVGNRCPHRSGPLVRGHVEKVDGILSVRCPIHGWLFDLATGRCLTRPSASTPTYPVACEQGILCFGAPQGEAAGPSIPASPDHPESFDSAVHPELVEGERPAQDRPVEG